MTAHALLELLLVLVAAKLAAEVAERLRVPAVLGEIAAGMLLGPYALGLVRGGDFLLVVGEIGVILLLLEVGMEMDLRELAKVGKASMTVAVAGMVIPFVTAWAALSALGHGGSQAVFLGAALTATSVGITARAFGDLRALASIEARVVIGAAVADDVLGLIVLTVVVPIATGDGIGGWEIVSVVAIALTFLVITTGVGLAAAPKIFSWVNRHAVSAGALVTLAFAFTLAFAELAHAAELAPIIGAFVAGLALSRTRQAERITRELAPIGHLFIPVFFFLIGTQADLSALANPEVLLLAGTMSAVAVAGKVVAGWFAVGTDSDRLLVGIAMVPRGEVGLIFATIGRTAGVIDDQLYTALLMVVLVTTVVTPPLLRWRHGAVHRRSTAELDRVTERPDGGWLSVGDDELVLCGMPDPSCVLEVALDAARLARDADPGSTLLDWFDETSAEPVAWTAGATAQLIELLGSATARGWRLLDATAVLDRAAPELAEAMTRRRRDLGVLDAARLHEWPTVERLGELLDEDGGSRAARQQFALLEHPDLLRLAALLADVINDIGEDRGGELLERLALPAPDRTFVTDCISDAASMRAAASHVDGLDPTNVMVFAAHVGHVDRVRSAYVLALAVGELPDWQQERLDELLRAIEVVLTSHPDDANGDASVVDRRRAEALALASTPTESHRIRTAPSALVLSASPVGLVQTMALLEDGAPPPGFVRVEVVPASATNDHDWEVSVVGRDTPGFLARVASGLAQSGLTIRSAAAASWPDGVALDSFVVVGSSSPPDADDLSRTIRAAIRGPLASEGLPALEVDFDNQASPWHTICTITGPDRTGVLSAVTTAFAVSGINVQMARITTDEGHVSDRFWLTDAKGRKLDAATQQRTREAIRSGVVPSTGLKARVGRR